MLTGLLAVGDSACCTHPSLGRGMTMELMHARVPPRSSPVIWATRSRSRWNTIDDPGPGEPWYQNTVMFDRARKAEIDASIEGRPALQPPGPAAQFQQALGVAMLYDPDVFRGMMSPSL